MDLLQQLAAFLPPQRMKTRLVDRVSYASDAGFYQLIPRVIVQPVNEEEISRFFAIAAATNTPVVFRAGGTSLSGQAITDGILVDLSQFWQRCVIADDGDSVRVQPGITGSMVNARLYPLQKKIGPDPSSIGSAMMGGILSNNASGMCCGVRYNSYHTTRHIRFMLVNGRQYSTESAEDYLRFGEENPDLSATLRSIRGEVAADAVLHHRIRHKYQTKNTVGYSLNALIDYEKPLDIFAHLLIGGEGTLAFIAEAVLQTIPDFPCKATAMLYFTDVFAACKAIEPLIAAGAEMVELMDRASLRAVENGTGMDPLLKTLPPPAAALLIEFQEENEEALRGRVDQFLQTTASYSLLNPPAFTSDPYERELLWKMRKGMFPSVGAVRASGTTVILEDIAVPLASLGDAVLDLQELFKQYAYDNAIIFGHAKDGNLHFVVTQDFDAAGEVERYDRFLHDVVHLVLKKYDGALKAEHGTGRNMAPFVEAEWGGKAYEIMCRIKAAADPANLLNPGVIISGHPDQHIRNLKPMPSVEKEVEMCTECGFCEHRCPSRDLTLTPRRRIVVRRALALYSRTGEKAAHDVLLKEYQYDGLDTCAVDGLCGSACPVGINTGDLVKRLRREQHGAAVNKRALYVARHFGLVESAVRFGLSAGYWMNRLGANRLMPALTKGMRKIIPAFPLWTNQLGRPPAVFRGRENSGDARDTWVYFPTCISRVMGGGAGHKKDMVRTFASVAEKLGVTLKIPASLHGSCCGQIFSSKGYTQAYAYTAEKIVEQLWTATEEGKWPVVTDVSSCTHTLLQLGNVLPAASLEKFNRLKVVDSIGFLDELLQRKKPVVNATRKIVLHPVCSLTKMNTEKVFYRVARYLAAEVTIPLHSGCCGMAGDRGFLFPELTASATRPEADEVKERAFEGYYSTAKTCEMAMSEAVGVNYESILYLADEVLNN